MKVLAFLLVISSINILVSHPTFAESTVERVTLMLTGSECGSSLSHIEAALRELPGVRALDGYSIPGHMLIDVDKGRVTADELAHMVTELSMAQSPCQASVMESCITAGIIAVGMQ